MFTFDRQGFEQNEWTIDKRRTPAIRICDRADFKDILANRVWYLKPEDALKAERPRFQIASVHSRVTGEYLAAITKALDPEPKGSSSQGVIAMATPLLSLIRPVLPPDFGFAIIDQSGNVQFHSDPSKNGQENFLDEVRDGRDLRAAVAARHDRLLTVSYLGFEHRVFVSPISSIQQCPWSLIVFSTLSNISVQRIERMLLFSTLALFYYAIVIVPVALGLYFWTRRHGGRRFHRGDAPNEHHEPDSAQSHSWTCPCDEDRGEYRHLALSLILVV